MIKKLHIVALVMSTLITSGAYAQDSMRIIPAVKAKVNKSRKHTRTGFMQTSTLSQLDLKSSPSVTISNVLRQEQSIVRLQNTSGDNSQSALSIRGFGDNASANSLILIDGFPLSNPTLLAPNINALMLEDIDHLDIYQGSLGTLWGDSAVGGVVNITTQHPEKFIGSLNAQGGSFNQQHASALMGNKMENGITLKGFILRDTTDNYREHNHMAAHSGLAQIGFDGTHGTTAFTLRDYTTTTFLPGGLSEAQYHDNPRQATNTRNLGRYHTTISQFINKHELSGKWVLETRLANQNINGDGRVNVPFHRNEWQWLFHPRLIGTILHGKLITGYTATVDHFHMANPSINNTSNDRQQGIYAEITFPLADSVQLTLGGRDAWQDNEMKHNQNNTVNGTDRVLVSEQGLTYELNPALHFYLRRDGNFSFAKANEQTWVKQGQSSLQPQTGVSYETGGSWQTEKQRLQLSLYDLLLHDEIAFDPTETAADPFGAYQNYDRTTRHGATLTEKYQINPRTIFNTQINYVDARFSSGENTGKQIPAVPAINSNIGLAYNWTDQWQTKFYALYTGSRYASEDNANAGKHVPGYWLSNIAMQYAFATFSASFEIDNLLNQTYSSYTIYDVETRQNTYYPGYGRSYLLTLKASID